MSPSKRPQLGLLKSTNNFSKGDFSWESGGTIPKNSYKLGPMKSYTVKKNHIGSANIELILYTQTNMTDKLPITFI